MSDRHDEYLAPRCAPATLDLFTPRSAVLRRLRAVLPELHGVLLDVGCGEMPYRSVVLPHVTRYVGLDIPNSGYGVPDLEWDGAVIPLHDASVDVVLATELFEHCPDVESIMREIHRVLKPNGLMFFTVPFLWPLHTVPHDEYRYTPFSLHRHLTRAGFTRAKIEALGGWDASLAQMLGLWVKRRPMAPWKSSLLAHVATPIVRWLHSVDEIPENLNQNGMITGLSGVAYR
jgi:SAM-dependent methyltransferase